MPATLTSIRVWVGYFASDPEGSSAPGIALAGFRYATDADGNAYWRCVSGDGATLQVTQTNVAVTASEDYEMKVEYDGTTVLFYIDDELVATHAAIVPAATQLLGPGFRITTLTAAARDGSFGWLTHSNG